MKNRLAGHTNSYHTYSLDEALEGIAAAGYKFVELTAVRGWTEHVPLSADAKTLGQNPTKTQSVGSDVDESQWPFGPDDKRGVG